MPNSIYEPSRKLKIWECLEKDQEVRLFKAWENTNLFPRQQEAMNQCSQAKDVDGTWRDSLKVADTPCKSVQQNNTF